MKKTAIFTVAVVTMVLFAAAAMASAKTYKMTTPIAPGVAVPDKLDTSIGTLNLNYGYHMGLIVSFQVPLLPINFP